jgi:hypothetical protein
MTLWALPRTSSPPLKTTEDRQARGADQPFRQVCSTAGFGAVSLSRVREAKSPHARLVPPNRAMTLFTSLGPSADCGGLT